MKRIGVVLLVMAMALVIASPVGAGKPDCTEEPTHPSCKDDQPDQPLSGTTCLGRYGLDDPDMQVEEVNSGFDITLGGENASSACVDVWANEGSWTVDFVTQGTVRSLMLIPRDSRAPGDSCGGRHIRKPPQSGTINLPGANHPLSPDGDIEGSYVNSCGTQFGEWAWAWVDVAEDGNLEWVLKYFDDVEPGIPSPLAFQMDMSGSKDAVVELTVHIPGYEVP